MEGCKWVAVAAWTTWSTALQAVGLPYLTLWFFFDGSGGD